VNEFISVKDIKSNFEDDIKSFFDIKGRTKDINIISAYFDLKTLDWMYTYAKKNKDIKIQIFVDRYSSKIFSNKDVHVKLTKTPKNIKIFLVRSGKLFHSKLYYIKSDKEIKVLIGSLNFTYNAFQENEEILNQYIENVNDRSKYLTDIEKYIDELKTKSEEVTSKIKNNHINNDLRSLLLDGFLYYESKEQESFSFKLKLPDDLKKIDTNIDPTLEANIVDSLTLERLVKESSILKNIKFPKKDNKHSRWKDYCIETCYGYWSPSSFNSDVENILNSREKLRKPYFDEIKKLLENHEDELERAFLKVCKKIIKRLNKLEWEYSHTPKAKDAWKKWRTRLLEKFNNKTFYNRLILGISKVSPPDIWNDEIASEEFEDSFLDSLIYHWSKEYNKSTSNKEYNKSTSNKVANIIAHNLKKEKTEYNKPNISEELKKEIEEWLYEYIDNENNIFKEWDYS